MSNVKCLNYYIRIPNNNIVKFTNKLIISMSDPQRLEASSEDVQLIKEWLKTQPHLPDNMDELVIRKFLFRFHHSLQVTKSSIDMYYTIRSNAPEVFQNRDPLSTEIKEACAFIDIVTLPKRTKDNYTITLYRLRNHEPEKYKMNTAMKYAYMIFDLMIGFEPVSNGDVSIVDMTGVSIKHIGQIIFSTLRLVATYSQEAQPIKIKQFHIINTLPIADKLFTLLKPLIKPEYIGCIHFHLANSGTLFDFVSRENIPVEYGGTAGSMDSFLVECFKKIQDKRDYFLNEKLWAVDESRRPGGRSVNNLNEGSFKTLAID